MSEAKKVPVSERALIARINRKLKTDGQVLKKLRGDRWLSDLGRFYMVDFHNHIAGAHFDLEELGKELGALRPWEELTEVEE